jgi:hypothetical protein
MAKTWKKPSAAPGPQRPPDTITGIAKTYHGCATAFAASLGLPLAEALQAYHGPITAIFIEACRQEIRVPASVRLPLLGPPNGQGEPEPVSNTTSCNTNGGGPPPAPEATAEPEATTVLPRPTTIPPGLPCAGQAISVLRPAQLRMLLSRVDQLAAEQGSRWRPLLEVLAAERRQRIEAGRRPPPSAVEGNGHGG